MNAKGKSYLFTSESVTEGHPDKVADQISDAILDAILEKDPKGRVACETMVTTGMAFVSGEITTSTYVDIPKIVRRTIQGIGYDNPEFGFDYQTCAVITAIQEQSPDIAMGVDTGGAGDQGMMFGYATNETPEMMPLPISLAHKLTRKVAELRKNNSLNYLRPDGKSQVTVEYVNGKPVRVDTVVLSVHHLPKASLNRITSDMKQHVIEYEKAKIIAWDVQDNGRRLTNRRVFATQDVGFHDGIRADVDGNIWCGTGFGGEGVDGVHVYAPDGTKLGQIVMPEGTANLCFVGTHRNRLFMTSSQSVYTLHTAAQGAHIT